MYRSYMSRRDYLDQDCADADIEWRGTITTLRPVKMTPDGPDMDDVHSAVGDVDEGWYFFDDTVFDDAEVSVLEDGRVSLHATGVLTLWDLTDAFFRTEDEGEVWSRESYIESEMESLQDDRPTLVLEFWQDQ